eukprot:PITA_10524
MPGMDPSIVQHEIKMYGNVKLVRQRLRPVNPRKAAAIKAEVEKLLKAGFIYPVPLTDWVSNPVLVDKKQGTIRRSFDALKKALVSTPLLSPPDYGRDFLLYLAVAESTIGMVLIQEDDALTEHVTYYLSQCLIGLELRYSPVEKLALAAVHAVQRLCHYILLRKTFFLATVNPFQFFLSR